MSENRAQESQTEPKAEETQTQETQLQETQGVAAVGFLVMAFTDEDAGDEALKAMKEAKKQRQFYFEEAAVIRQDANGKVHFHETGDMSTGKGAGIGALVGGVLGVLGGPAGIAFGAGAGAAIGAAAAHGDAGFRDESLKTVGLALKPGTSAVTAITSSAFLKGVQQQVPVEDIRSVVSNLAADISEKLGQGKSLALGLILAENGLAFKEISVDENSAEVVGMAITDEAVVAGTAVATAEGVNYQVAAATAEGTVVEAGTITEAGAVIVDDAVTDEGELLAATIVVPDEEATSDVAAAKAEKPAEDKPAEDKPAEE